MRTDLFASSFFLAATLCAQEQSELLWSVPIGSNSFGAAAIAGVVDGKHGERQRILSGFGGFVQTGVLVVDLTGDDAPDFVAGSGKGNDVASDTTSTSPLQLSAQPLAPRRSKL